MADLLAKQQKVKYYQMLKEKKYKRLIKDDNQLGAEREKQVTLSWQCVYTGTTVHTLIVMKSFIGNLFLVAYEAR